MARADSLVMDNVLVHPVFVGSIALLTVNDHLAKQLWPGAVTGKVSDFCGVAVVAILLAALTRRPVLAGWLTGVGFAALKIVPAVATAARPVLGGVTSNDRTDLVALVVLPPLVYWMRFLRPNATDIRGTAAARAIALSLCVLAVTATSQQQPSLIGDFTVDGTSIRARYADADYWQRDFNQVPPNATPELLVISNDGGRTWVTESTRPVPIVAPPRLQSVCLASSECFRVVSNAVESQTGSGPWTTSFAFSPEQLRRLEVGVNGGVRPEQWFSEIATVRLNNNNPDDGDYVVVAMGSEGVLVRLPNGSWQRTSVVGNSPTPIGGPRWLSGLLLSPFALLIVTVGVVVIRRPKSLLTKGALVASLVFAIALSIATGASLISVFDPRTSGVVLAAVCVATLFVTVPMWVVGRQREKKAPSHTDIPWPSIPPKAR
jgi:hypothetical protein